MPSTNTKELSDEERLDKIIEQYQVLHQVKFELRAIADGDQVIAKATSGIDVYDVVTEAENIQLKVEQAALADEEGRRDLRAAIEEDEARQAGL